MNFLIKAINNSRATLSVMVFILLAGVAARMAMNVELKPDVTVPFILVSAVHQGISAEDANRLLIKPLETELKSLDGIEELRTTALEGYAYAVVEFDISIDIDAALADVREAVNRAKSEFPDDTEEPIVKEISADKEPTLVVTFSSDSLTERALYQTVKSLRQRIEALPGVLEANMNGDREEVVEVLIDPQRMEYYNLTADELLYAVTSNNLLIPAGEYDTAQGRFGVKVPGLIEDRYDVLNLPVRATSEAVVTLSDVADIRRTFKDPSSFSHINGRSALSIEIVKRRQANAIETVTSVRELIAATAMPKEITIDYIFDVSDFAIQMVNELQGNILTAVILVMLVVVAVLGIRTGLLVGLGIPFSLLGTAIVVYLMGFTFNFMVIFGLLLSLGMLIDGAIVIMEYAESELDQGSSLQEAYIAAVQRMFMPVVASTATTLAVFLPLIFWPGVAGKFMSYLPFTVFAVLGWSLCYALFFGPVLGVLIGRWYSSGQDQLAIEKARNNNQWFDALKSWYEKIMQRLMHHPLHVIAVTAVVLLVIFVAYGLFGRGVEFFVQTEERYGLLAVRAQGNLSIAEKERLSYEVEAKVLPVAGVKTLYAGSRRISIGSGQASTQDQISKMLIELQPINKREHSSREVFAEIRRATANMPGIFVSVDPVKGGPPVGRDIQVQLTSNDRSKLRQAAIRVREHLESVDGLRDLEDSMPLPGIDWEVKIDRAEAAMLGVDTLQVGNMVQLVTNGIKIGAFRPDDAEDEVEIRVRYPADSRGILALDQLRVTTPNGPVPVSSFVTRSAQPRIGSIKRVDQQEAIFIEANTIDGVLADDKVKEIQKWLETANIDPAVDVIFRGANEEQAKSAEFLQTAFLMALFLMLILMVMQFNSFYQAFLILSAVVMSTAGVLLGLLVLQQPMSVMMSGIGIVALAGIVVNNNIVLIDTYNHVRRERPGISSAEAAQRAAVLRLRPVLLTTITTVVGLLPLASNLSLDIINRSISVGGEVASWWQQLAAAIVNGLMFSTFLTLLVTPAMLALPEYLRNRFLSNQPENNEHQH